MDIKVSVVVPIYNVEKYLRRCLESLKLQTYKDIEVIMVNDGSPDDSQSICEEYVASDERFILINKLNGGLSSARNRGLSEARGEYVCFVDSDDWVKENYIQSLLTGIKDSDIVISKYILDDNQTRRVYVPFKKERINETFEGDRIKNVIVKKLICDYMPIDLELKDTVMPVWKNMYKLSFLKSNSIAFVSEREVFYEDYIFNLQAYCRARKISMISDAEFVHVIQAGSLSQSYRKGMFIMQKKCYGLVCDIIKENYDSLLDICQKKAPETIAYSIFKESQCDRKTAISNITSIINDEFTTRSIQKFPDGIMSRKSRIIYKLAKNKRIKSLYYCIKMMQWFEKPYRYIQLLRRG